jgi:hypothetical protein
MVLWKLDKTVQTGYGPDAGPSNKGRPIPYNFMTRHVKVSFSKKKKKKISSVAQQLKSDLGRLFVEVYRLTQKLLFF